MEQPFIGSEALGCGALSWHQLRTQYRAVFPNIYLSNGIEPSLQQRITAAWLWSDREGTIAGAAAAALHGAKWIADDIVVDLVHSNPRSPRGVLTRRDVLFYGETQAIDGCEVTTPARTAFDIGRRGARRLAVARLDALARATDFKVLELVDAGAESPQESYLRLLLVEGGLPRPQTQIAVLGTDGFPIAYLDMGWLDRMVAVEYDGDQHRTDRRQYVKDIRRIEMLERMGWIIVRVVAEDRPADILRRVRAALAASSVRSLL
jgi:hypothetical protein